MPDVNTFPYFNKNIIFSNLPKYLEERMAKLHKAYEEKNLLDFFRYSTSLVPLIKNARYLGQISCEELEKFFAMLGRDWWNYSERIRRKKREKLSSVLRNFPSLAGEDMDRILFGNLETKQEKA